MAQRRLAQQNYSLSHRIPHDIVITGARYFANELAKHYFLKSLLDIFMKLGSVTIQIRNRNEPLKTLVRGRLNY